MKKKLFKIIGILLSLITVMILLAWIILPTGPRERMEFEDPYRVERVSVKGFKHMASTGNPWTTRTAIDVLERGGNAFDAAVASLLVLNVTYGEAASFPGVSPLIIYHAGMNRVMSYCGAGTAPGKATIDLFRNDGHETVPVNDIRSQLIPASPDMIIELLKRYGTMSFNQLSAYAITIAREGFPVHHMMLNNLGLNLVERFGFNLLMPYNVKVYLDGQWWRPLHHKERFTRPDLAATLQSLADAEKLVLNQTGNRDAGLQAVRDYFYDGPIADTIVQFHREEGGLFTRDDLSGYHGYWEKPLTGTYRDYTIYTNRTWCQGAVTPMVLQILEGIDLKSMKHNSPQYMHTVLQAIELAMADREAYFGDPDYVDVPVDILLSKDFAIKRKQQMTPGKAFEKMPLPGPVATKKSAHTVQAAHRNYALADTSYIHDTSYICIVDGEGNAVSLTPSDFPKTPMVPGTGLTLGNRMTQFRLDPDHPAALVPGKRPRITPNASMVMQDGKFFMTFGTPGGDMQTQAQVQVFLNLVVWGMNIQDAIDEPRFRSLNFPGSFSPHPYEPGTIVLEQPLYGKHANAMEDMGYSVKEGERFDFYFSAVCAIMCDPETGMLTGGADEREESWAEGR